MWLVERVQQHLQVQLVDLVEKRAHRLVATRAVQQQKPDLEHHNHRNNVCQRRAKCTKPAEPACGYLPGCDVCRDQGITDAIYCLQVTAAHSKGVRHGAVQTAQQSFYAILVWGVPHGFVYHVK